MSLEVQIKDNKIFAPLLNKWLVLKPEEEVRQRYICRLVNSYGYSLEQMEQEILVSNTKRGTGGARADIIVYKSKTDKKNRKNAIIIVECKADNITIQSEDYFQGANYAAMCDANFFVTTNLKETKIFKVIKGEIPKQLDEIVNIPEAKIIDNEKEVAKLLNQTKAFTRDEFSNLLFKCHNIIRNNDKLSPEAAFDEISKILFIKIRYERNNSEGQIFSEQEFKKDKESYEKYRPKNSPDFYQFLFEQAKEDFKDDDLFDLNESLKIRENSFEAIVKELQIYNLSTTSDDVKGIAFEKFLGKTFRGELGQFFTPRTVVDFMTKVLDPKEGEIVCDPCCGSGGFLIKTFEYVRDKVEQDIHQEKEKLKNQYYTDNYNKLNETEKEKIDKEINHYFNILNSELDTSNTDSRLHFLSHDCIFGTDANPRMSRTAKMNMIMHGDGHGGVHHNDGLLNVNGVFENRFDVILTNPPFGARIEKSLKITEADKYKDADRIAKYKKRYNKEYEKALKQINDNIGESLLSLYKTGSMSTLTEVLFLERCINLLKPGGRLGIVLPEGVLNNSNLQKVRDFIEGKAKIILITSIPQDVFIASGATVKPSLMFFKKFTKEEADKYKSIKTRVKKEVDEKYASEKNKLQKELKAENIEKDKKKDLEFKLRVLEIKITAEIKERTPIAIKQDFDYQIPIAEVEKAGISTTGAAIENELEPLEIEFTTYRKSKEEPKDLLWKETDITYQYEYSDGKVFRKTINNGFVSEPVELKIA